MDIRQQLQELLLTGVTEEGRELGRGAYGVVVEVKVNGLRCAGKKIHSILLQTSRDERAKLTSRFVEECLQHSRLRHPNIVQLLGVYFPSDQVELPLMVLEMMEMTLTRCIENQPNLPIAIKNGILVDVARGLVHLHTRNPPIIHRDLTTNNVLLSSHLVAKISDLGVAKIVKADCSQLSVQLTKQPGTAAYMPPEARTASPSYNTMLDVFSFGVLTLHVATNMWPLPDNEFAESPQKDGVFRRVPEVERRKKYIDEMGKEHHHMQLVCDCLQNEPKSRPSAQMILSSLESIVIDIGRPPSRKELFLMEDNDSTDGQPNCISLQDKFAKPIYIGLYTYDAKLDRHLSFFQGETMVLLSNSNSSWWLARSLKTGKEGYIPSNYVAPVDSLQSQEWFFGTMTRIDAEKRLCTVGNQQGTFLLRESESQPGNFSLSVLDGNATVKHYRINKGEEGKFYIHARSMYATLADLVEHFKKYHDGLCCRLTVPYPKNELPTTTGLSYTTKDQWEIERSHITLKQCLGTGRFGVSWQGLWRGAIPVGVKVHGPDNMTSEDFLNMAEIMKKLCHEKLIQLYAVCTHDKPYFIVTELMKYGNLLDFLQKGEGRSLKLSDLLDIATQIASGMIYLETEQYVHRNLAVRNVQVGERMIAKIDNFSRARAIVNCEYIASSNEVFPIRWTAPEAALYHCYSIKSDVWSFGILLTELVTYGCTPYKLLNIGDVISKVESGYRMPCPEKLCPKWLYEIMLDCWKQKPNERPTFDSLKIILEKRIPQEPYEFVMFKTKS